jgi:pimeloyl-ACP methyl ester carboxylesterase
MKTLHWGMGVVGLLAALLSAWQIWATAQGLEIAMIPSTEPPLTILTPATDRESRPLVLIGHGFAGSSVVMRGFGLTLAHAGYVVVLWDFDGHGANPRPFDGQLDHLIATAEAALAEARARGLGGTGKVAILGHSMGSGVALAFGQLHPETGATIAVSPVSQAVTPVLPHNLLLLAGSLEAPFVRNAHQLLAEAGGPGGNPAAGTARGLFIVPGVEHMSILLSPAAHTAARDWLDVTFGPQPGRRVYTDWRALWYGLGLLGALLVAVSLAPLVAEPRQADPAPASAPARPLWWRLAALGGGALGATLALWLGGTAGLGLRNLLGLLVGGYMIIWFSIAGLFSLILLRVRPSLPSYRAVLGGVLAFAALWLGVGWMGGSVWLPWLLISRRLLLWPLGGALLLPWFLAAGGAVGGASSVGRFGWWLAHSFLLVGGVWLALRLSPELSFLGIILPLFPVILGFHALVTAPQRGSWPFALSGALFTSWLLLAVFPLQ